MSNQKSQAEKRISFFDCPQELDAFEESFSRVLAEAQRQFVHTSVSEDNTQHFKHGRTWTYRNDAKEDVGHLQTLSAHYEVRFERIVAGDLSAIPETLDKTSEAFQRQFSKMFYTTMSEACAESGNVVTGQKPFPEALLEGFRKVEFGVNRDGSISLPQIHVGIDPAKLIEQLEAQPPEFHQEFERLKAEKSRAALEREAQRKARFKRHSD